MQITPQDAQLGRTKSKMPIGYRVLNLDRTPYRPFSTENVTETTIAGHYTAIGGVVAPDAGGHIVWGTAHQDMAETAIEPNTVAAELNALRSTVNGLRATLASVVTGVRAEIAQIKIPAPVVVETIAPDQIGAIVAETAAQASAFTALQAENRRLRAAMLKFVDTIEKSALNDGMAAGVLHPDGTRTITGSN